MLAGALLVGGPTLDLLLGGSSSGVHLVLVSVGVAIIVMAALGEKA